MKECNQCGRCCIAYADGGLSASADDIAGWEAFNPAIAAYVSDGKIWMDPASGEQLKHCPWLEPIATSSAGATTLYGCRIYPDRPEDCRHYPTSVIEMARDGCEMLELHDLDAPDAAQTALDTLMAASRPRLSGAGDARSPRGENHRRPSRSRTPHAP